jgi:bifunctional DNA-binding transcriptional regulator/antitoxin component of YhaV-PrlF toxin-antitoxin module
MKTNLGIIKELDKLGRLVIPKEMRDLFLLNEYVEIVITNEIILIRNPKYVLVKREKDTD